MPNTNVGAYIPSTYIFDVISEIYDVEINSPKFKELLVRLAQNINRVNILVNNKDTGLYDTSEFVNSQQFFPNPALNSSTSQYPALRNVFRKVINFGALPNATTTSVAHGIVCTSLVTFTRIYGCASDPTTSFIPLPYASCTNVAHNVELNADGTNVNITTGTNRSAYTTTYVILEYLKN
jgi:hypothetical protein